MTERERQQKQMQENATNGLKIFFNAMFRAIMSLALDTAIVMWCANHFYPGRFNMWDAFLFIILVRTVLPKSISTLDRIAPNQPVMKKIDEEVEKNTRTKSAYE